MATLKDYYNTNDDSGLGFYGASRYEGQTFTASDNYTISIIKVKIYKTGSPLGNVICSLWSTSAGLPNAVLTTGQVVASTLGTTPGSFVTFNLDTPQNLNSGTVYAITLHAPDADSGNIISWRNDNFVSPGYAGGKRVSTTSFPAGWSATATRDMMFETYEGIEAIYVDLAGTISGTGAMSGILSGGAVLELAGTIEGSGDMSAVLLAHVNVQALSFKKRLIVAGNNQIFYENV